MGTNNHANYQLKNSQLKIPTTIQSILINNDSISFML